MRPERCTASSFKSFIFALSWDFECGLQPRVCIDDTSCNCYVIISDKAKQLPESVCLYYGLQKVVQEFSLKS